jgi:WD40-like Beta Propeller Repeat
MLRKLLAAALLLVLGAGLRAQDAVITLGDSFTGSIDSAFDSDTVQFSSVAGALLTATVKGSKGFQPTFALHDETSGQTLDVSASLKGTGTSKLTLKSFALPDTGDYVMVIGTAQQQTGAYKLTTKAKIGKTLKSFKVDGASAPGGGSVTFSALPGVTLLATIRPDKGATDVPGVPALDGPLGPIDLFSFTTLKTGKKPSATVSDFVFTDLGQYTLTPVVSTDGEALPLTTTVKLGFPKVKKIEHTEQPTFLNEQLLPVSWNTAGQEAAAGSAQAAASFNGHRIAFTSFATNLVTGCGGGTQAAPHYDVFVRDLDAGTTTSVSAPTGSFDGVGDCQGVAINSDGNVVAFGSSAAGLVAGDTNGGFDYFVRNTDTLQTTRISVKSDGNEAHAGTTPTFFPPQIGISGDGNLIAFSSDSNNLVAGDGNGLADVFVHDMTTGTTTRVSTSATEAESNGDSTDPDLSLDGTHVAFASNADTLLAGDTNGKFDIYVKILATGAVLRASLTATGGEVAADALSPSISGDGRFVAFESVGAVAPAANGKNAIFVKDLLTGAVDDASVSSGGAAGNGAASQARLSASGQLVLFRSLATNFVASDANLGLGDIFLRDRPAGTTTLVDLNAAGTQANSDCYVGDFSQDGSHAIFLAFGTAPTNLWTGYLPSGDQNNASDLFVRF